ncbi:hypothetical protein [Nocardia brasiliensis]|nr:hypothetical protein [Nocardia brasiliensis]
MAGQGHLRGAGVGAHGRHDVAQLVRHLVDIGDAVEIGSLICAQPL